MSASRLLLLDASYHPICNIILSLDYYVSKIESSLSRLSLAAGWKRGDGIEAIHAVNLSYCGLQKFKNSNKPN